MTKKTIDLNQNYYFQFNTQQPQGTEAQKDIKSFEFAWELALGQIQSKQLDTLFPDKQIAFFPVDHPSLNLGILIQNLEIFHSYFSNQKDCIFLFDWPLYLNSFIPQIQKSYPQPITFTDDVVFKAQNYTTTKFSLLEQLQEHPVTFIETLDPRRLILNYLNTSQVMCFGGIHTSLQYNLWLRKGEQHPLDAMMIKNGLFPWLSACIEAPQNKSLNLSYDEEGYQSHNKSSENSDDNNDDNVKCESDFISSETIKAYTNLIKTLQNTADTKKINIVCSFSFLNFLQEKLDTISSSDDSDALHSTNSNSINKQANNSNNNSISNNISSNVVDIFSARLASKIKSESNSNSNSNANSNANSFILSKPDPENCLEFSCVNGFFSRQFVHTEKKENFTDFYQNALIQLMDTTKTNYTAWTKATLASSYSRNFFRYAFRLAREKGSIYPDTFSFLLSAQSTIDANFAFELYQEFKNFPTSYQISNQLVTIQFPIKSFLQNAKMVTIQKFQTIQAQKINKKTKLNVVNKKDLIKKSTPVSEDKYSDNEWVKADHPYACSFPNEDIFMEKLAFDIKKNMQERIKGNEIHYNELKNDFGEGLDIRETVRNWFKETIIIKETQHTGKADIGSVVFNFADPNNDSRYSWKSFWLAEAHDDSHLMFYASPYHENLIGPGIAKSEFGGFAVLPLDSYLDDHWHHPYLFKYAKSSMDFLLLGGALSNNHKSILLISNHPPSSHIIETLKKSLKSIVYVRLDEFPPSDIRRVRTFHILAEAGVRSYAQKYIRKD